MPTDYSTENAKEILDRFHQKGWNMYCTDNIEIIGPDEVIRQNLAESLDLGCKYVLLPMADNPQDPLKVMEALETLAIKLNRNQPTITIDYCTQPIVGFFLGENYVHVHTPEGTLTSYDTFKKSLDSIIQTK